MGKTKTALLTDEQKKLSGEEKYKLKKLEQEKKKAQKEGVETPVEQSEVEKQVKQKPSQKHGKKYKEVVTFVDKTRLYSLPQAIELVKKTSISKFDGTVELNLLVKKEGINANVSLPHQSGKAKRIEFATEKTVEALQKGKIEFDVLLATSDMMPKLVPFARMLGPKGLMPNPKNGTLVKDRAQAEKFSGNTLNIKTEKKAPVIHTVAGKVSLTEKQLEENVEAILKAINKRQIVKAFIKATIGPSIKLLIS